MLGIFRPMACYRGRLFSFLTKSRMFIGGRCRFRLLPPILILSELFKKVVGGIGIIAAQGSQLSANPFLGCTSPSIDCTRHSVNEDEGEGHEWDVPLTSR
jgi:hypothetical protein